jgi:hypothetical protein
MANTLPNTILTRGVWLDAYAAQTSIPAGSNLVIKNRSSNLVLVYVGPTAPAAYEDIGWDIGPGEWTRAGTIPAGSKVWLFGVGKVNVQISD